MVFSSWWYTAGDASSQTGNEELLGAWDGVEEEEGVTQRDSSSMTLGKLEISAQVLHYIRKMPRV